MGDAGGGTGGGGGISGASASVPRRDYDVFVSYARADNVPDDSGRGWVSGIRDVIVEDSRSVQGREFEVFFDTSEIGGMQNWRRRILGALRTSKVLLVCLSPNYFASEACGWEWAEYLQRQARMAARMGSGEGDDGTVASVFFIDLPESDPVQNRDWREAVLRANAVNLRPWFDEGPQALTRAEVREAVKQLGDGIWDRLERARRSEAAVGNLSRFNPYFVGRTAELTALHETLARPASIGVVTAVHGLGGLGKTELAVQYAHAFRGMYGGGVWLLQAEGQADMLALAATLGDDPRFGFDPGVTDRAVAGRAVLAEVARRAREVGSVLLILDNVSEPGLLAEPQVAELPKESGVAFVATTRLGEGEFIGGRGSLGFLELDGLRRGEGVELIRDHQPVRSDGRPGFADADQEQAGRDIVEVLGGLTLAVEQVAIYLGAHPDCAPSDFLADLHEGLTAADAAVADDPGVGAAIRHQGKTLAAVLATTLADMDDAALTVVRVASLLPPESVPWPWLHQVLTLVHPEAVAARRRHPEGDWPRIKRVLSGRRLLTPGDVPEVARMHRMHAAHLAPSVIVKERTALVDLLVTRAVAINDGEQNVPLWEYSALLDALTPLVPGDPQLAAQLNLDNDATTYLEETLKYIGDGRPAVLAAVVLIEIETLAEARPGDLDARRELSVSLNNVARMVANTEPGRALELYTRSLTIAEGLVAARPGDLDAHENLMVALETCASQVERIQGFGAARVFRQRGRAALQRRLGLGHLRPDLDPFGMASQQLIVLSGDFLRRTGLNALSEEGLAQLQADAAGSLQSRVGERLAEGLSPDTLYGFEEIMRTGDQQAALEMLIATSPNYVGVLKDELARIEEEIAEYAGELLALAADSATASEVAPGPSESLRLEFANAIARGDADELLDLLDLHLDLLDQPFGQAVAIAALLLESDNPADVEPDEEFSRSAPEYRSAVAAELRRLCASDRNRIAPELLESVCAMLEG